MTDKINAKPGKSNQRVALYVRVFTQDNDKNLAATLRCSTQSMVNAMKEFHNIRIDFIRFGLGSYQENIDTTTQTGELIFHCLLPFYTKPNKKTDRGQR